MLLKLTFNAHGSCSNVLNKLGGGALLHTNWISTMKADWDTRVIYLGSRLHRVFIFETEIGAR